MPSSILSTFNYTILLEPHNRSVRKTSTTVLLLLKMKKPRLRVRDYSRSAQLISEQIGM